MMSPTPTVPDGLPIALASADDAVPMMILCVAIFAWLAYLVIRRGRG